MAIVFSGALARLACGESLHTSREWCPRRIHGKAPVASYPVSKTDRHQPLYLFHGSFEDLAASTSPTATSSICSPERTQRSAKTISLVLQLLSASSENCCV